MSTSILTSALSADARVALRKAITTHAGWDDLRRARGWSLASMVRDDYLDAAASLGIDVGAIAREFGTGRAAQNRTNSGSTPIDRALDPVPVVTISATDTVQERREKLGMNSRKAADAQAAADFASSDMADVMREVAKTPEAPEFDPLDVPEFPTPVSDAHMSKIDNLIALAIGDDISFSKVFKTAWRAVACADTLKMRIENGFYTPAPVADPRAAQFAVMTKPALDFVPPSWSREFCDYLEIGATIAVVGPAGNGKTTGARKLLERAGFTVYEFDCTDATLPQDLIGRTSLKQVDGATVTEWQEGPIAKAFADRDGAILLNEYDALDPRTGMALQSALEASETRRVTSPDTGEQIRSHGRCPIVLTLNTIGHGASVEYQGRNALDGANRDRIEIIVTGYEHESEILQAHGFDKVTADGLAAVAAHTRMALAKINSREILSNRRLLTAAALIERCNHSMADAFEKAFTCRMTERERTALKAA